jgi:hypothetical protein
VNVFGDGRLGKQNRMFWFGLFIVEPKSKKTVFQDPPDQVYTRDQRTSHIDVGRDLVQVHILLRILTPAPRLDCGVARAPLLLSSIGGG